MHTLQFYQNPSFAMLDVLNDSSAERVAAETAQYYSHAHESCEICGWMQATIYDPLTMDYQSFATWPMIYPGESFTRDVLMCRVCFDRAIDATPSINNPEDEILVTDDDFAGFEFDAAAIEDVLSFVPIDNTPQIVTTELWDAILLQAIRTNAMRRASDMASDPVELVG